MLGYNEMQALANLFGSCRAGEEEAREKSEPVVEGLNPGHIGPQYSKNAKGGQEDEKKVKENEEEPEIDIEKDAQLHGQARFTPEYEFVYKQAVSCSDVYMQMSEKDCSSLSCEDLVISIKLPEIEEVAQIDLDVGITYLKLICSQYYLGLYLPHKVNKERSSAKWDAETTTLTVTMPIIERVWLNQP